MFRTFGARTADDAVASPSVQISATQPLFFAPNPYSAAAASPSVCEAASRNMENVKEVVNVEQDIAQDAARPPPIEVAADADDERMEMPAPTTPGTKRHMKEQSTPAKIARGAPTPEEVQQQILTAVLALQTTTQDTKLLLSRLTDRVVAHDKTLDDIEQKLTAMQKGNAKECTDLTKRMDDLQLAVNKNDEKMRDFQRKLDEKPAAAPASSSSSSALGGASTSPDEVVVLGGFHRNTPRQIVETSLRPVVRAMHDRINGEIKVAPQAPYLLGSCGHLRLHRDLAHRVLQEIRSRDYFMTVNGERLKVWATLQKPREIRERSKKLIRMAAVLQASLRSPDQVQENYKVVCWRSSSVVILGRKVCSLNDNTVSIEADWYDPNLWTTTKEALEQSLLNDE